MKRICTICARGGSKGIKNKNIRKIAGKPLLAYSILQAKESKMFDIIAISSDSDQILEIGKKWGADELVKRPLELATDTAGKIPAIRHCFEEIENRKGFKFDVIVDFDVTSPMRNIEDIKGVLSTLETTNATNVVTAMPARRSPYFNLVELNAENFVVLSKPPAQPILRRQDSPSCYDLNASVFAWKRETLFNSTTVLNEKTRLYVMPEERSIDIDSEIDFEFVEYILLKRTKENT